jgi:2-amino-4-hydroxy-6-hydroxymethyldihydropteridine diphosphokinase
LGSNVGERAQTLERALERMEAAGVRVVKRSAVYETEPQDVTSQPWFLNMVVEGETLLFPIQLLNAMQRIERNLGRMRGGSEVRRGPRSIDIDILLFAGVEMDSPTLTLPHPRLLARRFVLEPLSEIAPDLRDPKTKELLSRHLPLVKDQKLRRYDG